MSDKIKDAIETYIGVMEFDDEDDCAVLTHRRVRMEKFRAFAEAVAAEQLAGYSDLLASRDGTINYVLAERGERYGEFVGHAAIAQEIKRTMRYTSNWPAMDDDAKEALEMIAHKIARILNGDPTYADSWVDIAGYAKLVADRLSKQQ